MFLRGMRFEPPRAVIIHSIFILKNLIKAQLFLLRTRWVRQFPARAVFIFILNVSGSLEIQPQNFASHYRGHSPTASAAALKAKIVTQRVRSKKILEPFRAAAAS
ncbi:hypothetical protein [Campylobacter sp.]|uniref:hypothetical protein n=1 Tax=Campylobacter sp. TaxID=205 RepID=UPI002A83F6FF|nr:hypothetical protein [Campylobacter sp.]